MRRALLALALACIAISARAEPLGSDVEALVRKQLAPLLAPREIDRLLSDGRVRVSLASLFDGWDGVADEVVVAKRDGEVVIQTFIRERRCLAHLDLGPEANPEPPVCDDTLRVDGDRKLTIDDDLWKTRTPKPPAARRPQPPRVADVGAVQHPTPPEPKGPVDNTVLRREPSAGAMELGTIELARAENERLKDAIRKPHYKDPLLPADPVEAGAAIRPFDLPPPVKEARVMTNLRNPFDESRMHTEMPVPDMLTLPHDNPGGEPLLPAMRDECRDEWRLKSDTPQPPTLDCYRRVAWNDRLDGDDVYQALSHIASILQIPLLDTLVAMKVQDAVSHQAHRTVWALMWIAWVKDHPERTSEALAALTPEERRFVRRRLADWWVEARLAELRPTITVLFERHFLGLYPEAMDLDGLPRRTFVSDTWLWANNWLAVLDERPTDAITAAYGRLTTPERRVINAFVGDRDLSRRWARVANVLASL